MTGVTFRETRELVQFLTLLTNRTARSHRYTQQRATEPSRFRRERAAPTRTRSPRSSTHVVILFFFLTESSSQPFTTQRARARKRDIYRRSRRHGHATAMCSPLCVLLREHVITSTRAAASLALTTQSLQSRRYIDAQSQSTEARTRGPRTFFRRRNSHDVTPFPSLSFSLSSPSSFRLSSP